MRAFGAYAADVGHAEVCTSRPGLLIGYERKLLFGEPLLAYASPIVWERGCVVIPIFDERGQVSEVYAGNATASYGTNGFTLEHLEAPALFLIVKDRVLAHNTVAALY